MPVMSSAGSGTSDVDGKLVMYADDHGQPYFGIYHSTAGDRYSVCDRVCADKVDEVLYDPAVTRPGKGTILPAGAVSGCWYCGHVLFTWGENVDEVS